MSLTGTNWLWVPPDEAVPLPVVTRVQELPLGQLRWDTFQRLCARLANRGGDVEFCQEYGTPGQDQEGIDIYIRRPGTTKYSVWQCKRYQRLAPAGLASAVTEFLQGQWASKTDEFVVCVTVAIEERSIADEIERQAARLSSAGISFQPLGIVQLSEALKHHPDLVDDFFGPGWPEAFCGTTKEQMIANRTLSAQEVADLRALLRTCYASHFEAVDPGLPSISASLEAVPRSLSLPTRFVVPDVLEKREA